MSALFGAFARRPQTIAGIVKSHQRQAPLRFYQRWEERAPRLTNAAIGGVCAFVGDAIAQKLQHDERQSRKPAKQVDGESLKRKSFTSGASFQFDYQRSMSFVAFNCFWAGLPLLSFVRYMDRSGLTLTKKLAVSHGVWNPFIYMPLYFFGTGLLKGETLTQCKEKYVKETPLALFNCMAFWIPVNVVQFSVIPSALQVPFLSGSLMVWSVILSSLGASKPQVIEKMEADRELTQADGMKPIGMDDALHFVETRVPFVKSALDSMEDEVMAWKQQEEDLFAIKILHDDLNGSVLTALMNLLGLLPASRGQPTKLRPTPDEVIMVKKSELLGGDYPKQTLYPLRLRPQASKEEKYMKQHEHTEDKTRAAVLMQSSRQDAGQQTGSCDMSRGHLGVTMLSDSAEGGKADNSPQTTIGTMSTASQYDDTGLLDSTFCGELIFSELSTSLEAQSEALKKGGSFVERPGLASVVWFTKQGELDDDESDVSDEEDETLPIFAAKDDAKVTRSVNPDGIKLRRRDSRLSRRKE